MKYIKMFLSTIVCGSLLCLTSCSEEDSGSIDKNTPFYQKYKVVYSDSEEVLALAHFSKNEDKAFEDIKLEGEQGVLVNKVAMNYHEVTENDDLLSYTYSKLLPATTTDVTFQFTRNKGQVYENSVSKRDINEISIPAGFKLNKTGKTTLVWEGTPAADGEKVEGQIVISSTETAATIFNGNQVDNQSLEFDISSATLPGTVTLVLVRSKTVATTQNNEPAKGEILLCYKDVREVATE